MQPLDALSRVLMRQDGNHVRWAQKWTSRGRLRAARWLSLLWLIAGLARMASAHPIDEVRSQALIDLQSADGRQFDATVFLDRAHLEGYEKVLQQAGLPPERDRDELAESVRRAFDFGDCRTVPRPLGQRYVEKANGAWVGLRFTLQCPPTPQELTLTRADYSRDRTRTTLLWTVTIAGREPVEALIPPHLSSLTLGLDGAGVVRETRGVKQSPLKDSVVGASPAQPVRGSDYAWPTGGSSAPPWSILLAWAQEGALHLALGPDHLLFLLTLVLAGRGLGGILAGVSAFSLGHVSAMAISLLAHWPPLPWLDVVIGGTIALSAWQARRATGLPPWRLAATSFVFGLIHGLGFGAGLQQLVAGVDNLWYPLLSFGLGLDLAQILWVAVAAMLWRSWLRTRDAAEETPRAASALMVGGLLAGVLAFAVQVLG